MGTDYKDLKNGTWYQSAVSGLWYDEAAAAGDIGQVMVNNKLFIHKATRRGIVQANDKILEVGDR